MALILPSISATYWRRNFQVRTRVNEIEAMYKRPHVNLKVERGLNFTFLQFIYAYKVRENYAIVEMHPNA